MLRNNFISKSHRYHDKASLMLRVFEPYQDIFFSFSAQARFENKIKLDCLNLFVEEAKNFHIFSLGSSDGTLCLHEKNLFKITLWNLTTNQFNPIPPSLVESYLPDTAKVISQSTLVMTVIHVTIRSFITHSFKVNTLNFANS